MLGVARKVHESREALYESAGLSGPRIIAVDPTLPTDVFIESGDVAALSYRLWVRRADDAWCEFGADDMDNPGVHHWMMIPPLPPRSEFAYSLAPSGCANRFWCVRIGVRQRVCDELDGWTIRALWTETGVLNDDGQGGEPESFAENARRAVLRA